MSSWLINISTHGSKIIEHTNLYKPINYSLKNKTKQPHIITIERILLGELYRHKQCECKEVFKILEALNLHGEVLESFLCR